VSQTSDPFVGTWKLNPPLSEFSPHHRPLDGRMVLALEPNGHYVMTAEGINEKGEKVAEQPQRFVPDGKAYPIPNMQGLTIVCTRPEARTLHTEARREDGSLVGQGTFVVSVDGASLMATTTGYDTQLRQFRQRTAWDRA
jgi:hypothetical protein